MAVGTWGQRENRNMDAHAGNQRAIFSVARTFTASSTDASVPNWVITDIDPALLADFGVVFDGVTPPDAVTINILDVDGLAVATATGVSSSGRTSLATKPSLVGGCTVQVSGNTTNSAVCKVILNFLSNRR
jgi:hypothetical protein